MLSYIELSFQAPSYDHNLLTRVYTLTITKTSLQNKYALIEFIQRGFLTEATNVNRKVRLAETAPQDKNCP